MFPHIELPPFPFWARPFSDTINGMRWVVQALINRDKPKGSVCPSCLLYNVPLV